MKTRGSFPLKKNFHTENFPKISLLKVENFRLQNFSPTAKFVSANHILQNYLSAGNFSEWKWTLTLLNKTKLLKTENLCYLVANLPTSRQQVVHCQK
jgi:hypothetical protein